MVAIGVEYVDGLHVSKRTNIIPAPISVPPTENWEGIDGEWNTFAVRVGDPPQFSRVLISTTSQQTWVVDPRGCPSNDTRTPSCTNSRGGVFSSNKSSTWAEEGIYYLGIEKTLELSGMGRYGYDQMALGYLGQGGPLLKHQVIGAIATEDFWFGHFGLHPKTTNFTSLLDNIPSFMSTLRTQNLIPSVSWGYTQGALYRKASVLQ